MSAALSGEYRISFFAHDISLNKLSARSPHGLRCLASVTFTYLSRAIGRAPRNAIARSAEAQDHPHPR